MSEYHDLRHGIKLPSAPPPDSDALRRALDAEREAALVDMWIDRLRFLRGKYGDVPDEVVAEARRRAALGQHPFGVIGDALRGTAAS